MSMSYIVSIPLTFNKFGDPLIILTVILQNQDYFVGQMAIQVIPVLNISPLRNTVIDNPGITAVPSHN